MTSNRNAVEDHENGIRYGGKILSLIPAEPGWVATVYSHEGPEDGSRTIIGTERRRVHGWALVEHDGVTGLEAMFVESPGFPTCASLHNSYAPDYVDVYVHYDPEATDITEPSLSR